MDIQAAPDYLTPVPRPALSGGLDEVQFHGNPVTYFDHPCRM